MLRFAPLDNGVPFQGHMALFYLVGSRLGDQFIFTVLWYFTVEMLHSLHIQSPSEGIQGFFPYC